MAKYIKNLNNVLYNTKLAGAAINARKSKYCKSQIDIINYIYSILKVDGLNVVR